MDRPLETWRAPLAAGEIEMAWGLFVDAYRPLLLSVIQRLIDEDDVPEAFAHVCEALSANSMDRLGGYRTDRVGGARFSTWLVAVVHNLVVDWVRRREGRRRTRVPGELSELQRSIFVRVFVEHRSHAETYELVRQSGPNPLSHSGFLKELAETYRIVERVQPSGAMHYLRVRFPPAGSELGDDETFAAPDTAARLTGVMETLSPEDRVAVQMFVVDGAPAADVARILGWPAAKTVYNHVYRALHTLRARLEADGIGPGDL